MLGDRDVVQEQRVGLGLLCDFIVLVISTRWVMRKVFALHSTISEGRNSSPKKIKYIDGTPQ